MTDRPRICFCTSEAVPFAKTGGLADVSGTLPRALADAGCDIRMVLPGYRAIDRERFGFRPIGRAAVPVGAARVEVQFLEGALPGTAAPVYLVANDALFGRPGLYGEGGQDYEDNLERFTAFCRGALALIGHLDWRPHVVHCQDWQTALLPVWLRVDPRPPALADAGTLLTVHNLAYLGLFPADRLTATGLGADLLTRRGLEFFGKISLLKGGVVFADLVSTVSEQYAREIQTPEFGCGLEGVLRERASDLVGILNGVDYGTWDPAGDRHIAARYTAEDLSGKQMCKADLQRSQGLRSDPRAPLLGMVSRLADQKGLDLIAATIDVILGLGAQCVVLGTGDPQYHALLESLRTLYPGRMAAILGFDEALAHRIEAGADIFLMPSRYEPSGLNQLYSLRYGTVPVVRRTGGLADTVVDATPEAVARGAATGFVFEAYTPDAFLQAVKRALAAYRDPPLWRQLQQTGMRQDFSWSRSAARYVEVYHRVIARRRGAAAPA